MSWCLVLVMVKKMVLVISLEDILVPGKIEVNPNRGEILSFLECMNEYSSNHPSFHTYLIASYKESVCHSLLEENGLVSFFDKNRVLAVNDHYLDTMDSVDRERYDARCADDPFCQDEYFRQVEMKRIMQKEGFSPEQFLLMGHDYWFDGFYTRRFSKVDVVFVESCLSVRGKPTSEKIQGLWYTTMDWKKILPFIQGTVSPPNYKSLDSFVATTLSQELLGAHIPSIRKTILERKGEKYVPISPLPDSHSFSSPNDLSFSPEGEENGLDDTQISKGD